MNQKRMFGLVVLVTFALCGLGCVKRQFAGADRDDIKFCRLEARLSALAWQGNAFNECMRSLGYTEGE